MKAFRHLTHSYVLLLSDFLQKVNNKKHEIPHTIKCVCVCKSNMVYLKIVLVLNTLPTFSLASRACFLGQRNP